MSSSPYYLCLMRHAKPSWQDGSLTDHQRPLNSQGREEANLIGSILTVRGYAPDIIWSSDATRTRETAMHLIRTIPGAQEVHYNSDFYHASSVEVSKICNETPFPQKNLMLLGHNPGWSDIFTEFTGQEHDFPTAACAVFEAKPSFQSSEKSEWFDPDFWSLVDLLLPRELA